jgi:fatty-acyl-CoA synthase
VNEEMKPVQHNGKDVGEIVVRAPWCTREYYKDEEKTQELWRGGWLHTGDVANIDEHGYLMITGRTKFIIKSGGEWISPTILEDVLSTYPGVKECAVFGVPNEKWGERPIAVIVSDRKVTEEEVKKHFYQAVEEGKILKWWVPDRVYLADSIPKTSVGKIDVLRLMEEYRDRG